MRPPRRSSTAKGPPTAGKPGTLPPEQDATGSPPDDRAAAAAQADPGAGGTPAQPDAGAPAASWPSTEGADPKPPSARLLGVAEAAALFGCSRQAIRDRARRGELTSIGTGRRLLFSKEEVRRKLEDQILRRILSRR